MTDVDARRSCRVQIDSTLVEQSRYPSDLRVSQVQLEGNAKEPCVTRKVLLCWSTPYCGELGLVQNNVFSCGTHAVHALQYVAEQYQVMRGTSVRGPDALEILLVHGLFVVWARINSAASQSSQDGRAGRLHLMLAQAGS